MTTIFENDFIKVSTTDRDYDFIAVIENKTNQKSASITMDQVTTTTTIQS